MKTLLLMRHAKSSWADPDQKDHDRPLNKRGIRTAPIMAQLLKEQDLIPTKIVSSTAVRARQTADAISELFSTPVVTNSDLYLASPKEWAKVLEAFLDEEIVLSIGHNPGIESFVSKVCGDYERMPTAAIAHFSVAETEHPLMQRLSLVTVWRPKELD